MRTTVCRVATAVAFCCLVAACGSGTDDAEPVGSTADTAALATDPAESAVPNTERTSGEETTARCATVTGDSQFDEVPCDEPHEAELAGIVARPAAYDITDDFDQRITELQACAEPVEALTGRSLAEFGIEAGIGTDVSDEPSDDRIACYARVNTTGALSAAIGEVGLDAALGDYVIFTDTELGSCYVQTDPEGYDVGLAATCDDPDAIQFVAAFDLPDDEYADTDAVADAGWELCDPVAADPPFDVIEGGWGLSYPEDEQRLAFDRRAIACVVSRAVSQDGSDDTDPASTNCAGRAADQFPTIPCDEPHATEFVASAPSPFDTLPEDSDEATDGLMAVCRPVVEDFLGRSVSAPGAGVGVYVDADLGGPVDSDIECFVNAGGDDLLVGMIADVGFDAALNGVVVVNEMEPGSCFELGDENFAFGTPVDCSEPDALMHLGSFELDDGPYPGDDAIRVIRDQRCGEMLTASGLDADPATVSGTFDGEDEWNRFDRRTVTCDASPL